MKITRIKTKAGKCPSEALLIKLATALRSRIAAAHFITGVSRDCSRISQHMRSFSIDTSRLGSNVMEAYRSPYGQVFKRGLADWTRTNLPTWKQRVEFNDIVNDVFDRFQLSARIISGPFTIRSYTNGRCNEQDWYSQRPAYYQDRIVPLTEDMIEEANEIRREHRKELAQSKQRNSIHAVNNQSAEVSL